MRSLARWCFRHRRIVLGIWVLLAVGTLAVNSAVGTAYSTQFKLPGTQSAQAQDLLTSDFAQVAGSSDQIVVAVRSGKVTDSAARSQITAMLTAVSRVPDVRSVIPPFGPAQATQVSPDGTVAFATVIFDGQSGAIPNSSVTSVIDTAQRFETANLQVELGGQDITSAETNDSGSSTALGILFALIVLLIAFGAVFAATTPIITAGFAIVAGFSLTGLLSHAMSVANFAPTLGVLIGLGVGVDYALFIVTRHRNGIIAGLDPEHAAVDAIDTGGRAVFFAGLTVCIALLGQFVLRLPFLYGLAISASLTVLLTMVAALTLLPALLGFLGLHVLSRHQRRRLRERGPVDVHASGPWNRWARFIERTPRVPLIVAVAVVVVLAVPYFRLDLGLADAGSDPSSSTTHRAYELLAAGFGPGFNGTFELVAELPAASDETTFAAIVARLGSQPGVAKTTPPTLSPNGKVAVALLYPTTSPQSSETSALLNRLRNDAIPQATAGSGINVHVGGVTAVEADFQRVLSSKLPMFIGVVVLLGFVLLMAVFRSLLIPLLAAAMNLLAIGASLGILNAVFSWGWGSSLLGVPTTTPVLVYLPVVIFAILFGLATDYEVFLVSRIREEWVHRGNATDAVTIGQAASGTVITAAAGIMTLVFLSFALSSNLTIQQFGIGLAGAIVAAYVLVMVALPCTLHLVGWAAWWLPRWLDRILPHLHIEGRSSSAPPEPPPPDARELVGAPR